MLADKTLQLLTAYVDGELSPRERQAVLRLLHESSEAREVLRQLQENAHKIQELPRRALDAGFAADVVRAVAERKVAPEPVRRPVGLPLRWLPYAAAGLAASIAFLFALAGALYLALGGLGTEQPLAKQDGGDPGPPNGNAGAKTDVVQREEPRKPNPLIPQLIDGVYGQYAAHIAPERSSTFAFQDLPKETILSEVTSELKKSKALQLDITVRNQSRAFDRLRAVLKKHGVTLVVDPGSETALKKGHTKTEFLIYADTLKPGELTAILKDLAHEEKKTASAFNKVSVASLSTHETQQVASLFGTDPTKRVDPNSKKGMKPGPKPKSAPEKAERVVVVLPQTPQAKASEEVRQFLFQPAEPQPGDIPMLLRIRQE
jgi:hypothetical protein